MRKFILIVSVIALFPNITKADLQMPTLDSSEVKSKIESAFIDAPSMVTIAKCESGFRQ